MRLPEQVADRSGRIIVNRMGNEIIVDGKVLYSQPMLVDFVAVLARSLGKTVPNSTLNEWRHYLRSLRRLETLETNLGYDHRRKKRKATASLHARMSTLRKILRGTKANVESVYGVGYKMTLEDL